MKAPDLNIDISLRKDKWVLSIFSLGCQTEKEVLMVKSDNITEVIQKAILYLEEEINGSNNQIG